MLLYNIIIMNIQNTENIEPLNTENNLINKVLDRRAYFRERNRINYHKRKEAGTLKKRPSKKKVNMYIHQKN